MLKVLIADDEERICKLICALADWDKLGMEVAGIALNGPDALAMAERLKPDILITDLRMPGCDGLEVIRRAKESAPDLEVIIISGYAQFDYARQAIQYGVGEYLLKPINKEHLNNTLAKMGAKCLDRASAALSVERLKTSSQEGAGRLRESMISDLMDGVYAASSAEQLEKSYRFSSREGIYQAFILKMDYEPDQFAEPSLNIVRNKACDIFTPALSKLCDDFILSCRGPSIYGVVNYPARARPEVRMRLRDCLNQLIALRALFGSISFSIALGQAVMSPGELTESFQNAQIMISERIIEETGRLIEGFAPPTGIREMNLLARYSQAAARFIETLNLEEADSAVNSLENAAAAAPDAHGWEYLDLVRGAAALFASRLDIENREKALSEFNTLCGQCENVAGLFSKLQSFQADHISKALQRHRDQEGQPIRAAKLFIQKNFDKPITLEQVSGAIGFTPSYFSAMFKKETGEGFTKYLSKIRVREAKGLLRDTRLPIHDICKRVGYADIKHFTRIFKSEAGITPGEFRKLYG